MYKGIYLMVLMWGLLMLVVFLAPLNKFPGGPEIPLADKVVHVFLFAVFSFLLLWARLRHVSTGVTFFSKLFLVIIIAIVYGALIEFSQSLMNLGRMGSFYDLIADLTGSVIGCLLALLFIKQS